GEYWVNRDVRFDEVFTGPRKRQIETAALVGEAFRAAGRPWPEPQMLPEFDEHQVDRLIKLGMPEIAREHPHVGPLHEAYRASQTPRDTARSFQLMFEQVVMLWAQEKIGHDDVEAWAPFRQRVRAGFERIVGAQSGGRGVAAFTSVGAVTVCLQIAL